MAHGHAARHHPAGDHPHAGDDRRAGAAAHPRRRRDRQRGGAGRHPLLPGHRRDDVHQPGHDPHHRQPLLRHARRLAASPARGSSTTSRPPTASAPCAAGGPSTPTRWPSRTSRWSRRSRPNRGPAAGGTAVTIAGSNFKAGATVTFGGAAADSVTVVSSSQITCTTPAHFPAAVDVTVTNPDSAERHAAARLHLREHDGVAQPAGHRRRAACDRPGADQCGQRARPGRGRPDGHLRLRGAQRPRRHTGSLTPGWSLAANTTTPGQIRLSMASPGGTVTGSGVLALLEFEVVGAAGSRPHADAGERIAQRRRDPGRLADGSFAVAHAYSVAGTVRFWQDSSPCRACSSPWPATGSTRGSALRTAPTPSPAPAGDYTLDTGQVGRRQRHHGLRRVAGPATRGGPDHPDGRRASRPATWTSTALSPPWTRSTSCRRRWI